MEKIDLQRLLSYILAASIAVSAPAALAQKSDTSNSETLSTTSDSMIDSYSSQITDELLEEWFLEKDYYEFLTSNGIKVVDGNIGIETVEQFELIALHFKQYLVNLGVAVDMIEIGSYIDAINWQYIPGSVREGAREKGLIFDEAYDYTIDNRGNSLKNIILDNNSAYNINDNSAKGFMSINYIIFSEKERMTNGKMENYILETRDILLDTSSSITGYENIGNDFANFLYGEESSFPYTLSELDRNFILVCYLQTRVINYIYMDLNVPVPSYKIINALFEVVYSDNIADVYINYCSTYPGQKSSGY